MLVHNIRETFKRLLEEEKFVTDKTGTRVIEIVNASFIADEETIFGNINHDYVEREIEWYLSQSLNVNDIPGDTPKIWQQVATDDGRINSNYGWCVFSEENGNQYGNVLTELRRSPDSRRAIMIYTRPSMWTDYNKDGMSDFCCTNNVQYLIRNNSVHAVVNMRSNDSWAGYRNDFQWQKYVLGKLVIDLCNPAYDIGNIYWNAGSLHVYSSQFYLVDHYAKTGELSISKSVYKRLKIQRNE